MNDERLEELKEKYKDRNIREELVWGCYAKHSGYISKQDGEFINWLCNRAITEIKEANKAAGVESHSEKEIYQGCIRLMRQMVKRFEEYLDIIGIDLSGIYEDERFHVNLSNFEIVQNLFLYGTTHSGGTSTREKCKELGLDDSDYVEFHFTEDPNANDKEDV